MKKEENVRKVLRVGVANNFNFTKAEIEAVKKLDWKQEDIFVNSNSFVTITADYPSFLTINPYLDSWQEPVGDLSKVRACRIKYVADAVPKVREAFKEACEWCVNNRIPILITFMRFICKNSMMKFVNKEGEVNYKFKGGYYRLTDTAKDLALTYIEDLVVRLHGDSSLLNYCDLAGEGCPACGNCAKLAMKMEDGDGAYELHGINLAESGDAGSCIFHCPDCWAKRIAQYRKPTFGKINQNSKQRGFLTKH